MDNPKPTEREQEQADTPRQEEEEAMRYPQHQDTEREGGTEEDAD